jgi:hypothetical protein
MIPPIAEHAESSAKRAKHVSIQNALPKEREREREREREKRYNELNFLA